MGHGKRCCEYGHVAAVVLGVANGAWKAVLRVRSRGGAGSSEWGMASGGGGGHVSSAKLVCTPFFKRAIAFGKSYL
jgi:hypothetical protein